MIPVPRLLEYVVEILKASARSLVAREICNELRKKGVIIEKIDLNQILWKQNDRSDLVVDKNTFKWRYDHDAAEKAETAETRKEEYRRELANQAGVVEFWENAGFEFLGVWRKGTEKPFFFLREEGGEYVVIGPTGRLFREKANIFSEPDTVLPSKFTAEQIEKAAKETLNERNRRFIEDNHRIINLLRETEALVKEVYLGPSMERIEDVIPVSAVIFVADVSGLESCAFVIGWETVLAPLYLVINILNVGNLSVRRYGVFRICVYELIKRDLVVESEGILKVTLNLENDRVYIGAGKHTLYLT